MAVKVKVVTNKNGSDDSKLWTREDRLLPTAEEVGNKLEHELVNYAPLWHTSVIATPDKIGHVKLSNYAAYNLASVASAGVDNEMVARADHVHKFPTLEELGALEKEHQDVLASENVLGHVNLTSEMSDSANLGSNNPLSTAPRAAAVIDRINSLEKTLMEHIELLQGGVKFYGVCDFGWTGNADTDLIPGNEPTVDSGATKFTPFTNLDNHENPYTPKALADKYCKGISPDDTIRLFDFTGMHGQEGGENGGKNPPEFNYYEAKASALTWGEAHSILDEDLADGNTEPPNGTQITISRCFLDIDKNVDALKLAGTAIYSVPEKRWNFLPDEEHSIDNDTIQIDSTGSRRVRYYSINNPALNPAEDYKDFDDDWATTYEGQKFYAWIDVFFHKIRGLRYDVNRIDTELDNASEELTFTEAALPPESPDWSYELDPFAGMGA